MPVVKTAALTHRLQEVHIHQGGALTVMVLTEAEGLPAFSRQFEISQANATPYWGAQAIAGKSRWDDLCEILYGVLVEQGDLAGEIE